MLREVPPFDRYTVDTDPVRTFAHELPLKIPRWRRWLRLGAPAGILKVVFFFRADRDPSWHAAEAEVAYPAGVKATRVEIRCRLDGGAMVFDTPTALVSPGALEPIADKPDGLVIAMKALRQIAAFDPGLPGDADRAKHAEFALSCLHGTARKAVRAIEALDAP